MGAIFVRAPALRNRSPLGGLINQASAGYSRSSVAATARASTTSAAVLGIIGSRAGTTEPDRLHGLGLGDRNGPQRIGQPKVSASLAGITLAQRPVRTCENSRIIEFDSSVGRDSPPALAIAGR